jgi:hypothetical protein
MALEENIPKSPEENLSQQGLALVNKLDKIDKQRAHILISCSKTKGDYRGPAKDLYRSPLFSKSRKLAEMQGFSYSILSAKHGLVAPDEMIDPYDQTLKGAPKSYRVEWGRQVADSIKNTLSHRDMLIFLAGNDYFDPLKEFLDASQWRICLPLQHFSLGTRLSVLDHCLRIQRRRERLGALYSLLENISLYVGLHTLPEAVAGPLPAQGVYFFFDPHEATSYSKKLPRLVRIGTHAVSAGSKATLRNRLRTHLGTKDGSGNHRGSVFRLHVGQALIARDELRHRFPSWGKGQSAKRETIEQEGPLEKQVSSYLAKLMVVYIPIPGLAAKDSMRATIERHLIALFTENWAMIEPLSDEWLGRWSNRPQISRSGLWNVRCVGEAADLRMVEIAERLAHRELSLKISG